MWPRPDDRSGRQEGLHRDSAAAAASEDVALLDPTGKVVLPWLRSRSKSTDFTPSRVSARTIYQRDVRDLIRALGKASLEELHAGTLTVVLEWPAQL